MRCSHLNRALVAKEENAAKAEYLGLMSACFWLGFAFQFLALRVCENRSSVVLWFGFIVSETDSLVESQLWNIVILK
ncbi:hypothetical protein DZF72_02035 [Vibrio parahaemolyticus]|nr:hypothetical protein [Vibrio parahaemolyticus]EGR2216484.1 hypothetical protein [Vibrio parahaemolyticus]